MNDKKIKLIIQIPCYNEEETLEKTVSDLPKKIDGIDIIETQIIDDGSSDNTIKVAKEIGVDHIIALKKHSGLAEVFSKGIETALDNGADIIVNTDADNQYYGPDIAKLVKPILDGEADIVVGDRCTAKVKQFSFTKKLLQKVGTKVACKLSGLEIKDAVSGFRAYSREAASKIYIQTEFSYTIETLIQAGRDHLKVVSVPIKVNRVDRKSRLVKSIPNFIINQFKTMVRAYTAYYALTVFTIIGMFMIIPGVLGIIRFLYYFLTGNGSGHIQSIIISVMLIITGTNIFLIGLLADSVSFNRKLIKKILYRINKDKSTK